LEGRVGRLGSPAKVQPWLVATTLGAQAAHTTPGRKAAALRESVRGRAFQKLLKMSFNSFASPRFLSWNATRLMF